MVLQKPLSCQQLKDIAILFSEKIVITFEEIECSMTNGAVHQILRMMPVMILKTKFNGVFLYFYNLHEFAI